MPAKQNPFSLFDFLGYFIPGAFFLYALLFLFAYIQPTLLHSDAIVRYLSFEKPDIYIPFVILSYIVGHLLSFISSITIEQYSIWQFGYPSKFLLGFPCRGYFSVEEPKYFHHFIRLIIALIILPITMHDLVCGKLFRMREFYTKSLDTLLADVIKRKIKSIAISRAKVSDPQVYDIAIEHDFFRYIYHYALENAPNHLDKMQNYVALYGFLRTIALMFVCFFWIIVLHVSKLMLLFNKDVSMGVGVIVLFIISALTYIFGSSDFPMGID